jgi:hypothetical protein
MIFSKNEGRLEEFQAVAVKQVLPWQIGRLFDSKDGHGCHGCRRVTLEANSMRTIIVDSRSPGVEQCWPSPADPVGGGCGFSTVY